MKESNIRAEVFNLLRRLWYWPITQTDAVKCHQCGAMFFPKKGRPDIITTHDVVVEVKACSMKRFAFANIDEAQRRWLSNFLEDNMDGYGCQTEAGPYLALGTTTGRAGSSRKLWLIPWQYWLEYEKTVQNLFEGKAKSVPAWIYAGMQHKDLWTESHLSLYNRFGVFECEWINGKWHLKPRHPLMQRLFIERDSMQERDIEEESKRWQATPLEVSSDES